MSTGADRSDADRLGHIEGTVEQMDKRIDDMNTRLNERFDTLDGKIDENREEIRQNREAISQARTDMRRWLYFFFVALSAVFTVVTAAIQLLLA